MKHSFPIETCSVCTIPEEKGVWEYIWGISFKELLQEIKWREIIFILILFVSLYAMFQWIGIIVALFLSWIFGVLEGGAVADLYGEYDEEIITNNICSAGIENCMICDNPYSHEFNVVYNKEHRWYNF